MGGGGGNVGLFYNVEPIQILFTLGCKVEV